MSHPQEASQLIGLFRDGKDTLEIARAMNMTEAAVYNGIYHARQEEMGVGGISKRDQQRARQAKYRAELRRIRAEFA